MGCGHHLLQKVSIIVEDNLDKTKKRGL